VDILRQTKLDFGGTRNRLSEKRRKLRKFKEGKYKEKKKTTGGRGQMIRAKIPLRERKNKKGILLRKGSNC